MPAKAEVIDVDRGWEAALRGITDAAKYASAHVMVGWPERKSAPHGDSHLTVAQIAACHEFGTVRRSIAEDGSQSVKVHIPKRSMLVDTMRINEARYSKYLEKLAFAITHGRIELRTGLDMLGQIFKGDVQQRIADGIAAVPPGWWGPGLHPKTIERKGSSKPLIDTGQMRGSLDYEVRDA